MPAARRGKLELEPTAEAPAQARRFLAAQLADTLKVPALGVLQLAVSELVTNAIVHGIAQAEGEIELHVAVADDIVRVEVCDPGPGFSPAEPTASGETGWGLRLVDGLVECWGVAPDGPHCVWVEVGASPSDDADQA